MKERPFIFFTPTHLKTHTHTQSLSQAHKFTLFFTHTSSFSLSLSLPPSLLSQFLPHTQAHSLSLALCPHPSHTHDQAFEPQTEDGCEKLGQSAHCLVSEEETGAEGNAHKALPSVADNFEQQVCLPGCPLPVSRPRACSSAAATSPSCSCLALSPQMGPFTLPRCLE